MRALFVGGIVDNSELDLELGQHREAPVHYPENTGGGQPRYRLHHAERRDGDIVFAVYAAPELAGEEIDRIVAERGYTRRFGSGGQAQRS